jgi:hypothetical protein
MKKQVGSLIAIAFIATSLGIPANAAVKAGSTCKSKGQVSNYQGMKYTCIKSGKKLLWNKGTAIPKPVVQAAPEVSATPSPSPTQVVEVVPTFPTSFKDLEENIDGIAYSAWNSVQANIKKFPEPKTKVSMFFGPNTPKRYPVEVTEKMVLLGSRAMGNIPQPSEVKFYSFTKGDVPWAKDIASTYVTPFNLGESFPEQAEKLCAAEDCDGAVTNYASGIGFVLVGVSTPVTRYGDLARFNGQNDLHEYVHAVQGIIFANKMKKPPPTLMPCWYSEGQPQAVSILTSATSMQDYLKLRKDWMKNNRWPLPDLSASTIEKFLADNMKVPCPGSTNSLNYTVGYITMETLISIGGIDRSFDLLKKIADGSSFDAAFESEYQVSWAQAAPVISRIVSKAFIDARK